jgi:hypothetical protein
VTTSLVGLQVHLPNATIAPGPRALVITNVASGLPAGRGHAMVNLLPGVVSAAAPLQRGSAAILTVRHAATTGEVFFAGTAARYTVLTPTTVQVTVPPLPPGMTVPVSLRVGTVSGPTTDLAVAP